MDPESKLADKFINTTGKDDWATPDWLITKVEEFTERKVAFDLAALERTAKAKRWCGPGSPVCEDAFEYVDKLVSKLRSPHPGFEGVFWLNPPYARAGGGLHKWLELAHRLAQWGFPVAVLTFARTDTKAWHEFVPQSRAVVLLKGRVKFIDPETMEERHPAPAPSCIIYFDDTNDPTTHPTFHHEDWR
jgi:hypothetical protein